MNEFISVIKKYAVFDWRASRREYWMFYLINTIISFIIGFISGLFIKNQDTASYIGNIYALVVLLPSLGVSIRRMHDTDHSGWFVLVPIYNLILALTPGTKGDNKYGSDPYASSDSQQVPTTDFTPKSPV